MSYNNKKLNCALCKAYLFEEDDVVFCPLCGAPHHRDCYNKIEHCALEEFHGTDNEYKPENAQTTEEASEKSNDKAPKSVCKNCGEEYDSSFKKCPKCSSYDINSAFSFANFDFLGGIPKDLRLDDDVTADEAKNFVVSNTHRYIPKFVLLNKKNRISWNWMAFLFPCGWMLSRKMHKKGIIVGILSIIASLFTAPLSLAIYNLGISESNSYIDMVSALMEHINEIGPAIFIFALSGTIFDLIIRVVSGLLGDYWYKNYVISSIKKIKQSSEDKLYDFRKKGGVSLSLFLLGIMLVQYIPSIILVLI